MTNKNVIRATHQNSKPIHIKLYLIIPEIQITLKYYSFNQGTSHLLSQDGANAPLPLASPKGEGGGGIFKPRREGGGGTAKIQVTHFLDLVF